MATQKTMELVRQITLEMRGLREDLRELGLVPGPSRPKLRLVNDDDQTKAGS